MVEAFVFVIIGVLGVFGMAVAAIARKDKEGD